MTKHELYLHFLALFAPLYAQHKALVDARSESSDMGAFVAITDIEPAPLKTPILAVWAGQDWIDQHPEALGVGPTLAARVFLERYFDVRTIPATIEAP